MTIKKFLLFTLLYLFFTQTISSMNPGPPLLEKCPNCGQDKELMSLISGNTFGTILWSDYYQYSPMLPSLSPVQKCPHCGIYFMLSGEKPRYKETDDSQFSYCFDTGRLTFPEIKEAVEQLTKSGINLDEELYLRMEAVHRFNDSFREYESGPWNKNKKEEEEIKNEEDWEFHKDNLLKMISLLDIKNPDHKPLIAELYREAGMFDEAVNLIDSYTPDLDSVKELLAKIKEKSLLKDNKIFNLKI